MYNRNKRSICLEPEIAGRPRRWPGELLAEADVLIENFRPGTMDRLGLGLRFAGGRRTRASFTVRRTAFLAGPYEKRTALDEVAQMMGGLAYMTGPPWTSTASRLLGN